MKLPKLPVGISIRRGYSADREYWLLELGKRWTGSKAKRYTFATAGQACDAWEREKEKRDQLGKSAYLLSNDEIGEAKAALDAAKVLGVRLSEIIAHYRKAKAKEHAPSIGYDAAVKLALAQPMRPITKTSLKSRWKRFRDWLASNHPPALHNLSEVTDTHIRSYIETGGVLQITKRHRRDELSTLFRTAVEHGKLESNPCSGIVVRLPRKDHQVAILNVEKVKNLLGVTQHGFSGEYRGKKYSSAPFESTPMVVLGLFAGLRPNEILSLDWKDIRDQHIDLAAAKTKKGNRRVIQINQTLAAWLAQCRREAGPIQPENWIKKFRILAKLTDLDPWPIDCLRHSFASYHYAHYRDLGDTMSIMGHKDSAVFFAHYREVVTPDEANLYWSIFPQEVNPQPAS